MPIEFRIDGGQRLVLARAFGSLREHEIFDYQREVWSRPETVGYDEIVDMSEVTDVEFTGGGRARELAGISAEMDRYRAGAKIAIVAPSDYLFALGRMYQTYRSLNPASRAEVGVFRDRESALGFLGRGA